MLWRYKSWSGFILDRIFCWQFYGGYFFFPSVLLPTHTEYLSTGCASLMAIVSQNLAWWLTRSKMRFLPWMQNFHIIHQISHCSTLGLWGQTKQAFISSRHNAWNCLVSCEKDSHLWDTVKALQDEFNKMNGKIYRLPLKWKYVTSCFKIHGAETIS